MCVFVFCETALDLFPSKHLNRNKARWVDLVPFALVSPRSEYLMCDSLLLTFLNTESSTWLSIKTFKPVKSVGIHSEDEPGSARSRPAGCTPGAACTGGSCAWPGMVENWERKKDNKTWQVFSRTEWLRSL